MTLTKRPHQEEAVSKIVEALKIEDRTTALMACGSGKTLVGAWVAEELQAKTVLVLVPSLALMKQVLEEWKRALGVFSYLCVCSDQTVVPDDVIDIGETVSTQPDAVDTLLNTTPDSRKVVLATYHSTPVVGAGAGSTAFDLIVFDEAHKTAGAGGKRFAFALDDTKVSGRKRLFLTATPRHYASVAKARFGGTYTSMDDPTVYGRVAYTLSFADAVKRQLIVDYRILVCSVRETDADDEAKREHLTQHQAFLRLAIKKSAEKFQVKTAMVFMRSVDDAQRFAARGVPDWECFHVNGTMSAEARNDRLQQFTRSPRALITNVRCLTEGVDAPATDMVVFASPKNSLIDIAQCAGRAMRIAPNKPFGYILIPILVNDALSADELLHSSAYAAVWDVLRAMQTRDDALVDVVTAIAKELQAHDVVTTVTRNSTTQKIVLMDAEKLENTFDVVCVENASTQIRWEIQRALYAEYVQRCNQIPELVDSDPAVRKLAQWVRSQRRAKRRGYLTEERVEALNKIGFAWNQRTQDQRGRIESLHEFVQKNKRLPTQAEPHGMWLYYVCTHWGQTPVEIRTSLADLGAGPRIRTSLADLGAAPRSREGYRREHNAKQGKATTVTLDQIRTYVETGVASSEVLRKITQYRTQYKVGKMSPGLIVALEKIGLQLTVPVYSSLHKPLGRWLDEYRAFVETFHYHPASLDYELHFTEGLADYNFAKALRRAYVLGELSTTRQAQLIAVGFPWRVTPEMRREGAFRARLISGK